MANTSCFLLWYLASAIALLLLFSCKSYSQSQYGYLNIDCGEENVYIDDENIIWYADDTYIKQWSGRNMIINKTLTYSPMNTLRVFPHLTKNCYTLPAFIQQKYLVRAGFFYGNYDGASRPPTFDLLFDANKWATVVTSLEQPVFYEAVLVAKRHNVSVCVARTRNDSTPFISSLEMMQLLPGMYGDIEADHALFKQYRFNFGSNQTVGFPDDKYGRIWEPGMYNLNALTADFQSLLSTVPDDPPTAVIATAIQPAFSNNSVNLTFDIVGQQDQPVYITLYFAELVRLKPNQKRIFNVYINGEDYNLRISPVYQACSETHGNVYPISDGLNVLLVPTNDSNMPPIVSAMELYTVSETLSNGTSPEDLIGIAQITHPLSDTSKWSGDPCLPVAWECLRCNHEDPPRVTALYLANYELQYLGNFSDMQALEIIDLRNSSLFGRVPDFLGNFPMLKELNLADNDLWGTVPQSLLSRNILLNISGTQLTVPVQKKEKNQTGFFVGLAIASLVIALGCILTALVCHRLRGEKKLNPVELTRSQSEDMVHLPSHGP